MKKLLRTLLTIICSVIIAMITVPILVGLALQVGFIQNYAARKLTDWLSERTGSAMSIGHVRIGFFDRADFDRVYVQDAQGDTLIYVDRVEARMNSINFFTGSVDLRRVTLRHGVVNLHTDSAGVLNLTTFLNAFKPEKPREKALDLSAKSLILNNMRLTNRSDKGKGGDLMLDSLEVELNDLSVRGAAAHARVRHIAFAEQRGFVLHGLSADGVEVDSMGIRFSELGVKTRNADLTFDHLRLSYDGWAALRDLAHRVQLDARVRGVVQAEAVAMLPAVSFAGQVRGNIDSLALRLNPLRIGGASMAANLTATGLPDLKRAWFRGQIDDFSATGDQLMAIYRQLSGDRDVERQQPMADLLARAGRVGFSGTFDGLVHDFTATGRLSTQQGGDVEGRLQVRAAAPSQHASGGGGMRLRGHVETHGLDLGHLLAAKELGQVVFHADLDARTGGGALTLMTNAVIDRALYRGYAYTNIRMDGRFAGKMFEGKISSQDPNIHFETEGRFDLRGDIPAYDFELYLHKLNLWALHLNRHDSVSVLSARLRAHATGTTLDDINGTATVDSLTYISQLDSVQAGRIDLVARNTDQSKSLTMTSDFADIELSGKNSYSNIARFFGRSLRSYLPAEGYTRAHAHVFPAHEQALDDGYYLLRVDFKETNNLAAIFVPGLEVAKGTALDFEFNPFTDRFGLSLKSDYIIQPNLYAGELSVECRGEGDSVMLVAQAGQFGVRNIDMPQLRITGGIHRNHITLDAGFNNSANGSHAHIGAVGTLTRSAAGLPALDIEFRPTEFAFGKQDWHVAPSHVVVDSLGATFRRFRLYGSDRQQVTLDGRASASVRDTLHLSLSRFGLDPLAEVVNLSGYAFDGLLRGQAQIVAPLGQMQFAGDFRVDSFAVNQHHFGSFDLGSAWDGARRQMNFECITPDGVRPVWGYYNNQQKRYRFDMQFPQFDMQLLEPLLTGVLEETAGVADARLVLSGSGRQMELDGTIDVERYAATVAFTQARYSLAGPVTVRKNRFELPPVALSDGNGGRGTISAWFDSEYFRKLRFGVRADFADMLALNTTAGDNELFYGKVYGTGSFWVGGDEQRIDLDVRAETAQSGTFVLPLTGASTITAADFIAFREPQQNIRPRDRLTQYLRQQQLQSRRYRRRQAPKSELNISMNIGVGPSVEAQLVMDPRLGDAIKGRGNGRFAINVVPARDIFTMDGQFEITQGTYLFTLYGFVANKFFTIQPGGSITWQGDPQNPIVDIDAIYRVRAPLRPLVGESSAGAGGGGNVNVNCGIHLSENLFSPTVRLSIAAPGANIETQTLLSNLLGTEDAMTQQFAYLLLSNSFMPSDQQNAIGTLSGSLAGVAGMEFLSNQISNLISGSNYNIRFGYRPQGEMTSEEVTFDIGADLIADKLSLEVGGNYDVGQQQRAVATGSRYNPWSVDGALTWTLNKSRTLQLKGFTRTIDRFDESQGLQDSGIGVYYRQNFQDLADLRERYRAWRQAVRDRRTQRRATQNK